MGNNNFWSSLQNVNNIFFFYNGLKNITETRKKKKTFFSNRIMGKKLLNYNNID